MQENNLNLTDVTRFLANTLHEIRTPIQTIIGATELIQDTNLDKEQLEYIRQIQFSAEGLLNLANDILDLSKIQSNSFSFEAIPFSIAHSAEYIADSVSVKAFNKGVEIVTDIDSSVPELVIGDSMRISQVMLNLANNAVKFTKSGYIHIELSYKEGNLFFTITDSGIGISEDKQKNLFSEYVQADISTYRLFGGTGLGLAICKNLISLMKGKIGVRSNPEGGSVFWFSIPLPAEKSEKKSEDFKISPSAYRVLIVDDSLIAAKSLKTRLEKLGFVEISICTNGNEALELIESAKKENHPFNIAFIDMIMPGVDGWHLAFDIKNLSEKKNDISLYLLVPEGQMKEEAKMKMLGWYKGYLYKPVKNDMLQNLLKEELSFEEELETVDIDIDEIDLSNVQEIPLEMAVEKKSDEKVLAKDMKILIAEDHPMNRKLLEAFVRKFGADVYLAENGEKAVSIIKNNPDIKLIFMDIYMPEKNGIEAASELRKSGYSGVIIACTANNDTNDFADYRACGMNDILVKPFKSEMIKEAIEKWK